jgi:hypothetical protein
MSASRTARSRPRGPSPALGDPRSEPHGSARGVRLLNPGHAAACAGRPAGPIPRVARRLALTLRLLPNYAVACAGRPCDPRRDGTGAMCWRSCAVDRTRRVVRGRRGAVRRPVAMSPQREPVGARGSGLRPGRSPLHLAGKGRHVGHGKRSHGRRSGRNAFGAVPCGTAPKPSPVGAPRGAKWLRTGFRPRGHLRTPGYTGRSPPQDLGRRSHTDPGHLMMDGGAIVPLRVRYRSAPGRSDAPGPGTVSH